MMNRLSSSQREQVVALLGQLTAIESVNRNFEHANTTRAEERMAAFVGECVRGMGMQVELRDYQPGRPNLIAHWPDQGRHAKTSLMLGAHMDTVTVDGMTVDPFRLTVREGRAYGRGTCDTKGSMAAYLTALRIAREAGALPTDKLYFVATASEETGCQGAAALMGTGFRATAAIVGEPTMCRVMTCHKGPLWMTVETRGRSCHASMPDHGVNAVELMGRVVAFVHGPWQERIKRSSHPVLGRSTMSVTTITGGSKINIIPSECRAEIDGRFIPGQETTAVVEEFRRELAAYLGDDRCFSIISQETYPSLNCPTDAPIARKVLEVCRQANGQQTPLGVNYFADTGPFDQAGIQSVLVGPGDIAQAHTADEYIELDQLYQGTEIILNLLTSHAGRAILAG